MEPKNKDVLDYLIARNITLESIYRFNLGYFDLTQKNSYYNRILFPVHDLYGELLTYQGRYYGEHERKYWHGEFDKANHVHGLYENLENVVRSDLVVLTEGPFDMIAVSQAGYPGLDLLGVTLSQRQARLMARFCNRALVWLDPDKAGRNAQDGIVRLLQREGIKAVIVDNPTKAKDPSEVSEKYGTNKLWKILNDAERTL